MSVTRMWAVAVVAAVTVLSGCVPGGSSTPTGTPQVSVSPSSAAPSWMCTPEGKPGGVAHPCTEKQHRDQVEQAALYAEAEAVVRKGLTEDLRLQSDWRIAFVSDTLRSVAAGPYLEDRETLYSVLRDARASYAPIPPIVAVTVLPAVVHQGSLVSVRTCVDGRKSMNKSSGAPDELGKLVHFDFSLRREAGALRLWEMSSRAVDKC